ncbi:tripartite tricarboxylate transporter TctB family protein [Meridianimarinicoccus sp. MJW13]|uniref:tripartite tricarboxylate transporter TctB family protein n=1 Tax=Meridianimarinicoccus sp. MJW13 TaxID=2720031 RepID=UPI0018679C13|nr:tripartite tricarboxylate transporter TctB family protein [Fluviibacterium sp. MJW13]
MRRPDPDHHDGTADATPGGCDDARRPGELAFVVLLLLASLALLWSAYGISGFEALSAPGSVPMAATTAMVVTSMIVVLRTARLPRSAGETLRRDILPGVVVIFVLLLIAYALLLKPLGFLPTSGLFLMVSIRILSGRGWGFALTVSAGSLLAIWLIFRIVFTVLMPPGIVPEAEFIQIFRDLGAGGR